MAHDKGRITELFRRYDVNGDGTLEVTELRQVLGELFKTKSWWSDEQLELVIQGADKNHDGRIDIQEFVNWVFTAGTMQSEAGQATRAITSVSSTGQDTSQASMNQGQGTERRTQRDTNTGATAAQGSGVQAVREARRKKSYEATVAAGELPPGIFDRAPPKTAFNANLRNSLAKTFVGSDMETSTISISSQVVEGAGAGVAGTIAAASSKTLADNSSKAILDAISGLKDTVVSTSSANHEKKAENDLELALKSDDTEEMVETKLRTAVKSAEEIVTVWRLRVDTATSVIALVIRVQRVVVRSIEKGAGTSKLSIPDASKEAAAEATKKGSSWRPHMPSNPFGSSAKAKAAIESAGEQLVAGGSAPTHKESGPAFEQNLTELVKITLTAAMPYSDPDADWIQRPLLECVFDLLVRLLMGGAVMAKSKSSQALEASVGECFDIIQNRPAKSSAILEFTGEVIDISKAMVADYMGKGRKGVFKLVKGVFKTATSILSGSFRVDADLLKGLGDIASASLEAFRAKLATERFMLMASLSLGFLQHRCKQDSQARRKIENKEPDPLEVFIVGLPADVDESTLRAEFGKCGNISKLEMTSKSEDSSDRGCSITYEDDKAVAKALEITKYKVSKDSLSLAPLQESQQVPFEKAIEDAAALAKKSSSNWLVQFSWARTLGQIACTLVWSISHESDDHKADQNLELLNKIVLNKGPGVVGLLTMAVEKPPSSLKGTAFKFAGALMQGQSASSVMQNAAEEAQGEVRELAEKIQSKDFPGMMLEKCSQYVTKKLEELETKKWGQTDS
jgi:hypothetical protein